MRIYYKQEMEPVPLLKIKGVDMDYKKAALDAIAAAGGKENISHVEHCATRLRIETIDKEKVDLSGANDI